MLSVTETLKRLNWHAGRGEVRSIRYNTDRTGGVINRYVPITQRTGIVESLAFRIQGNRVYAFGSSRTRIAR